MHHTIRMDVRNAIQQLPCQRSEDNLCQPKATPAPLQKGVQREIGFKHSQHPLGAPAERSEHPLKRHNIRMTSDFFSASISRSGS